MDFVSCLFVQIGLPFSEKKIVLRKTEQLEILSHSVGIPSVLRNCSEFRLEPFRRKEKHSELLTFVPNHSMEDKNARNFVPNPFAEEKSNYLAKETFGNLF